MAAAVAANEVAKAAAMSPAAGAESLQKLGLDYLATFKILSSAIIENRSSRVTYGGSFFSILFPWRLARGEYLLRYAIVAAGLVFALGYPAFLKVRGRPMTSEVPVICFVILLIYKVGVLDAARFRDREKSGFFAFFMILPVANLVAQFYLWLAR